MATAFAARFYQGLAGGATVAAAFEEARAAMAMQKNSPPPGLVMKHTDHFSALARLLVFF